ncbi:SPOR domain-containing protein [Moraxella marmotae]|uniref:SPOR domain-containing protein n=1 Tax=Moraxella marmotae TaxID=3344520 RepID=UPI0035F274BD
MSQRHQKRPSAVYKDEIHRRRTGLSSLLWMFVGAFIVVAMAVILYLSPLFDGFRQETITEPEAPVEPIDTPKTAMEFEFYEVLPEQKFQSIPEGVSIQEQKASTPLPEPVTDLVLNSNNNQSADKPDDEPAAIIAIVEENRTYDEPSNPLTADESKRGIGQQKISQGNYILQIKSYQNAEDADLKRAEVLMSGVDAIVIRHETKNGNYLYQVISTPMSHSEAAAASVRLRNNGIDSLLIEQRSASADKADKADKTDKADKADKDK